jgi:PTH2 family peptidyl-tRNA hydrolase
MARLLEGTKQALVLRADLGMGKGKLVAQGAHASLLAYREAERKSAETVRRWEREGSRKVALRAESEGELLGLYEHAQKLKLPVSLVADAGRTQLEPGTLTALAIGPGPENLIDQVTGKLRLL